MYFLKLFCHYSPFEKKNQDFFIWKKIGIQECFVPCMLENCREVLVKTNFRFCRIFRYYHPLKLSLFSQNLFVTSLVKIRRMVLEKSILKCWHIFTISPLLPLGKSLVHYLKKPCIFFLPNDDLGKVSLKLA